MSAAPYRVEAIGIDETSRRGHRYITVVADLTERNVVCVVPGVFRQIEVDAFGT